MGISVSGLSSGIDWQNMIDQLRKVENQRVTLLTKQKTSYQERLSAWQTLNGKLSSLNSAAYALKSATAFNVFSTSLTSSSTVEADSLLSASASSSAARGTYQVTVTRVARGEKLASHGFSSQTTSLGVSGSILINGRAVVIDAEDSLQDIRAAINGVNSGENASGVVAGIIQESASSFRLVLTSETEGAAGISLLNGSSDDVLGSLGFNGARTTLKNQITGGAQSDRFTSSSTAVDSLLGLSTLTGNVTINGQAVAIDLSDTLTTIRDNLVAAGLSAQVVAERDGTDTYYRLQVENMTSWSDDNNVLQALGLVEGSRSDVVGVTSGNANSTYDSGSGTQVAISSSTNVVDIYGYITPTAGDKITISGTKHDGTAAATMDFVIDETKTVGDLLAEIENAFGEPSAVTASVTADGKIQVVDNESGTSQLAVTLTPVLADPGSTLDFGAFGTVDTVQKRILQQGEDAAFTIDGTNMTSSTNTVTTAIPGVTLNLKGEDAGTTVTVNVDRDSEGIEAKVQSLVDSMNEVLDFINTQMSYNTDTNQKGGPLFGDNTLKSIKSNLMSMILKEVDTPALSPELSYLSQVGITIGSDGKLSLDSDDFREKLTSNFDDVVRLFSDSGSSTNTDFQYIYSTRDTQTGDYMIDITQAAGPGVNVAGTIDGIGGLGTSDVLSMEDSSSAAYGLSIKYTGSAAPATATFSFTRGLASLLEDYTYRLTDSIDGTVSLRETSIKSSIDTVDEKITNTQEVIDRKMEMLSRQFQAMEAALNQMQALQSYVSSQLGSLMSE